MPDVRPQYEKPSDQEAEIRLGRIFGQTFQPQAWYLPIRGEGLTHIDGAYMSKGVIVAMSENKQRTYDFGGRDVGYKDYRIGERKVLDARKVSEILRVPVYLVVGFKCGTVASLNCQTVCRMIGTFGRHDRGDDFDTENGVAFDWGAFKIVKRP